MTTRAAGAWPHLPLTAVLTDDSLTVGGISVTELVAAHGSPLQILDSDDLDHRAGAYVDALDAIGRPARAVFATKALPVIAVVERFGRHGIGADVTTAGELQLAMLAGIDVGRVVHHGNARSVDELRTAVDVGVGLVVLDGPDDVVHLDAVATHAVDVLVRITPGIPPATHEAMATAHHGQKFGVTVEEAPQIIRSIEASRHLNLRGLHFHVGSQITTPETFADAIERVRGIGSFEILDAGGGLGVPMTASMDVPDIDRYIRLLDTTMTAAGYDPTTELIVEPGRSLVARAMMTAYRVRTVKHTAGQTFVAVDGGTSDDMEAVFGLRDAAPFSLAAGPRSDVTLVGLHCDSGDVLARRAPLGPVEPGSVVVMAGTGAYTFSVANNYNCALRPAVVEVESGAARVLVRRETIDDLFRRQVHRDGPR